MGEDAPFDFEALKAQAEELLRTARRQTRRAFVLEITGTPKAGKTSTIVMLRDFFKQSGWRVRVVHESAESCNISMKGHFFFNAWTTCTMLAGMLDAVDDDRDLVIIDRGPLDSLIWLELQKNRGQVTIEEIDTFRQFVNLPRWRSLVNAQLVLRAKPETAIEREMGLQLVRRNASLMNQNSLSSFNQAMDRVISRPGNKVIQIDTDGLGQKFLAFLMLQSILSEVRTWADPEIFVVDREFAEAHMSMTPGRESLKCDEVNWGEWDKGLRTMSRSLAESDLSVVQIVAAAVPTSGQGVFVFERDPTDSDNSRKYDGSQLMWRGCHMTPPTRSDVGMSLRELAVRQAATRLASELHIEAQLPGHFLGVVYTPEREPSHLALVVRLDIPDIETADHLKRKEFRRQGRRRPFTTVFYESLDALRSAEAWGNLEPWSLRIVADLWAS